MRVIKQNTGQPDLPAKFLTAGKIKQELVYYQKYFTIFNLSDVLIEEYLIVTYEKKQRNAHVEQRPKYRSTYRDFDN